MSSLIPQSALQPLLRSRAPLIDVRAEIEFERSALPQALNAPLLRTAERALVGTTYRAHGMNAAIEVGNQLVCGEEKERRIAEWGRLVRERGAVALYCARGGLRSEISQRWLREAGIELPRIEGGYKRVRSCLASSFSSVLETAKLIIVSGMTGSGKSQLLRDPDISPDALDLERLAGHFGSAFGAIAGSQPSQGSFESALFLRALELGGPQGRCARPIIVEDESRRIGKVMLPLELYAVMNGAERIEVVVPLELRVQRIIDEYIEATVAERLTAGGGAGYAAVCDSLAGFFKAAIVRLRKRLGDERARRLLGYIDEAAALQRESHDCALHARWIEPLLREYYDPLYQWDLAKKRETIVFQGSFEEVRHYLRTHALADRDLP